MKLTNIWIWQYFKNSVFASAMSQWLNGSLNDLSKIFDEIAYPDVSHRKCGLHKLN